MLALEPISTTNLFTLAQILVIVVGFYFSWRGLKLARAQLKNVRRSVDIAAQNLDTARQSVDIASQNLNNTAKNVETATQSLKVATSSAQAQVWNNIVKLPRFRGHRTIFGSRSPRWARQEQRTRLSSAARWLTWYAPAARRRSWRVSSNRQHSRSGTGWPSVSVTPAEATAA